MEILPEGEQFADTRLLAMEAHVSTEAFGLFRQPTRRLLGRQLQHCLDGGTSGNVDQLIAGAGVSSAGFRSGFSATCTADKNRHKRCCGRLIHYELFLKR